MVEDVAANGPFVLAIVEGNPYRSSDSGATWTEVHDGLGVPFATTAAAGAGVLAVAAGGAGPFRSVDGGLTWSRWTDGLVNQGVRALIFVPDAGMAFAEAFDGLYRATLAGGPWQPIPLPSGATAVGVAQHGGVLLAVASGTGLDHQIYRSVDAGSTWTLVHSAPDILYPRIAAGGGVAVALAIGFSGPAELLFSDDGGLSWTARPHPTSPAFGSSPRIFVDDAGRVYADAGNQLVRSDDLGLTWATLGAFGSSNNRVLSLHDASEALCLGTQEGVWCSTDDGGTFASANAGLPSGGSVPVIALVRDGEAYAALTSERGVFVSDAPTAGEPPTLPGAPALRIAPNPATSTATVSLVLARDGQTEVSVFDALGRRVATLSDGLLSAGRHEMILDVRGLRPGVYVMRVASDHEVAAARVVVR
jgi:photosystem II stability/assembly factor-like uncharacterized protein